MASSITKDKIQEMKQYLKDHPIDPAWDREAETLDGIIPDQEMIARLYRSALQDLGELEKDPPTKHTYTAEEIREWKQYVKDHPIHPEWDDAFEAGDRSVPEEECISRGYRGLLQYIGEWD